MPESSTQLRCPYTGRVVEVLSMGDDKVLGRISCQAGGYTTRPFDSRKELEHFLRMRDGVDPEQPPIEVRELVAPVPDLLTEQMKSRDENLTGEAADYAEKLLKDGKIKRGRAKV